MAVPGRRAGRLLIGLLVILAAAAAAALALSDGEGDALPPRAEGDRPPLLLVTSLPLIFAEGFSLESAGSPALDALESRYRVEPIGVASGKDLAGHDLLLMAQPLAQPAEVLVELDRWVREGGRVLILADPKLDRPSDLPLGDVRRPPVYFADTGLLAHWGLRLQAPDGPGAQDRRVGGLQVRTTSPGRLQGSCPTEGEGLVARCKLGKGFATVVADADLLDPPGGSGADRETNLQFLLAELDRLER